MTLLRNKCYQIIKKIGPKGLSDYFEWKFDEDPECVLIDFLEQEFIDFSEDEPAENFDGNNGLLAKPSNWSFGENAEDGYYLVTSNDWQSSILKYDDRIFLRVKKEMIYDYKDEEEEAEKAIRVQRDRVRDILSSFLDLKCYHDQKKEEMKRRRNIDEQG